MTHYDELGLKPSASPEEIDKAYRILAQKFHPDRNPGREAEAKVRFVRIQKAFEVLSNPSKRRKYDETLGQEQFALIAIPEPSQFADINIRPKPQRKKKSNSGAIVWIATAAAFVILVLVLLAINQNNHEEKLIANNPKQSPFTERVDSPPPTTHIPIPGPAEKAVVEPSPASTATTGINDNAGNEASTTSSTEPPQNPPPIIQKVPPAVAPPVAAKLPVPSDAAQKAAKQHIADLHLTDVAKSNLNLPSGPGVVINVDAVKDMERFSELEQKTQLANRLLNMATETNDDLTAKFVLLDLAANTSAEIGQCNELLGCSQRNGPTF